MSVINQFYICFVDRFPCEFGVVESHNMCYLQDMEEPWTRLNTVIYKTRLYQAVNSDPMLNKGLKYGYLVPIRGV